MAQGESRYNPNDRKVVTNEFPTAPTGDYTLQAKNNWRVDCKQDGEGNIPYVWGQMDLLGTANPDDPKAKNVNLRYQLILTMTPKSEDKKPAIDMNGGFTDLQQKLHVAIPDTDGKLVKTLGAVEGVRGEVEVLNAKNVKEFLESLGNFTIKAHVIKKPAKDGWPAKNEIQYFIDDPSNATG